MVDTPPASGSDHALSNANALNSAVSTSLGTVIADNVTIETGTWYSVWVVVNNSTNTWSAYVPGGAIEEATQLTRGGDGEFAFRNTSGGAINTLAVARGAGLAFLLFRRPRH